MKVSEIWLRNWVNPTLTTEQLAKLLTMAGLEVDAISPVAGKFEGVIVAKVLQTSAHPLADKLTLCDIDDGSSSPLRVVCGASNVRPGLKVALAQIGASLPHDVSIKSTKIRGEASHGMLCSAMELGLLDNSEGILELDDDAPIGTDLCEYMSLHDKVFEIALTPNRGDCLSILGIAREIAAITNTKLTSLNSLPVIPTIDEVKNIQIQEPHACPHYCGRIIRGINSQAASPLWMRERLRRAGIRPICAAVDVTNYVMLELGQPLHAFNLGKLQGNVTVRFASDGEMLNLLDNRKVALQKNILVIADSKKSLAIAGIMGGSESAIDETTEDIFLESAYFNPVAIAGVARSYGVITESSQRYERGVDPLLQEKALERATALLIDIAGGQAGPLSITKKPEALLSHKTILFNPTKIKKITGIEIPEETVISILQGLGMTVTQHTHQWEVKIPSHRFDLLFEIDLVEEVIRLYGYDNIPRHEMLMPMQPGVITSTELLSQRLNGYFTARGYFETKNYSFVDPHLQTALFPKIPPLKLLNPISSELSQMRVSLWPGLLAAMIYNIHRQQASVKFFEIGSIFGKLDNEIVEEHCVAGLLTGNYNGMNWNEEHRKFDFYDAKGDIQALSALLHLDPLDFEIASHPALHPGKTAQILIKGKEIGWCGVLHPKLAGDLDLQDEIVLFELKLNELMVNNPIRYQKISKFPQIRRDLSLLVDNSITVAQINKLISETIQETWLKSFEVFDVYTSDALPAGKKSLAVALTLQDDKRTLVDEEINAVIDAIIKKLDNELAIKLRD